MQEVFAHAGFYTPPSRFARVLTHTGPHPLIAVDTASGMRQSVPNRHVGLKHELQLQRSLVATGVYVAARLAHAISCRQAVAVKRPACEGALAEGAADG